MRRLDSITDQMRGIATYELSDGRRIQFAASAVEDIGIAELLKHAGLGHMISTERVPVVQCGRCIGSLPGDFDPARIRSRSLLYDPRPGDFKYELTVWVACPKLGPGDFDSIPGFERAPNRGAKQ